MKKISKFILTLLCLGLLFACSNELPTKEQTKTVNLTVKNETTTKTLLPNELTPAEKYVFTLTSTTDPKTVYTAESKTGSVSIEKVLLGSYSVNVKGYADTEKTALIQEGNSSKDLVVSISGQSNISIQMELIEQEGLTGAIKIPVDWSQVVSNASFAAALNAGLRFDLYIDGELKDNTHIIKGIDHPDNKAELTFKNIPTGVGKMVNIKLYNNATGQLLVSHFFLSFATINAGHTSVPDANEADSSVITPNMIETAYNISNVKADYNSADLSHSLIVSWNNPLSRSTGENLAKKVIIKYSAPDEAERQKEVTFDIKNAKDNLTGNVVLSDLTPGKAYTIKYSVQYFEGMYSSEQSLPYKKAPYVFVDSLTLDNDSIPSDTLVEGNAFNVKATILPENASDKTINWTTSDDEVLTFKNGLFEAHKPGRATITATTAGFTNTNKDTLSETSTKVVTVSLKTPSIYTETQEYTITVNWDTIPYAEEYALYEVIDGVTPQQPITVKAPTTSYTRDTGIKAGASYEYYVVAKAPSLNVDGFVADSAQSEKTAAITPIVPNITIKDPVIANSPNLQFGAGSVDRVITPDQPQLTFSITSPDENYTYTWYINGEKVTTPETDGKSIIITKDTKGVSDRSSNNSLMLKAEYNGKVYSATTTFEVIAVMDEAVEVYIQDLANEGLDGKQYLPLNAKIKLDCRVLPEGANQAVTFSSSNPEVVTVEQASDGSCSLNIKTAGDATITVSSAHNKTTSIDFKFYNPTFTSPLEILNEVNGVLRTHIDAANEQFNKDWWTAFTPNTYTSEGISIATSYSTSVNKQTNLGEIKLDKFEANTKDKGNLTLTTTTPIKTKAVEGGTYSSKSPLEFVGKNNVGDIKVDLPYNQGSVTIHYNNINVKDARNGSYSLTFDPIKVGEQDYYLFGTNEPTVINDYQKVNDEYVVTRLLN